MVPTSYQKEPSPSTPTDAEHELISGLNLSKWLGSGFFLKDAARLWLLSHVKPSRKSSGGKDSMATETRSEIQRNGNHSSSSSSSSSSSFQEDRIDRIARIRQEDIEQTVDVCLSRIPRLLDEGLERVAGIEGLTKREAAIQAFQNYILKISQKHDNIIIQLNAPIEPIAISDKMAFFEAKSEVEACFACIKAHPHDDRYRYELVKAVRKLENVLQRTRNLELRQEGQQIIEQAEKYFNIEGKTLARAT